MSKINIHIIERNITGYATDEEKYALQSWLEHDKTNRDAYFRMKNIWDCCRIKGYSQDDIRREWELFARRIHSIELKPKYAARTISIIRPLMRYAAIFVLAVPLAWALASLLQSPKQLPEPQQIAVTYQKFIVPNGQRSQVVLSDGSTVWLNSGTEFQYPSNFGVNNRQVILCGEACFQVTPSDIPFTVKADEVEITVLGTHFNVRNYATDNDVETALFEGSVKMQTTKDELTMHTGDLATYQKDQQTTEVRHVANIANKLAWSNNYLIIDGERFEDIARKLERWFNVQITITDNDMKDFRYTGKFVYNETVHQVLKVISMTTSIKYKIDGDKITISK